MMSIIVIFRKRWADLVFPKRNPSAPENLYLLQGKYPGWREQVPSQGIYPPVLRRKSTIYKTFPNQQISSQFQQRKPARQLKTCPQTGGGESTSAPQGSSTGA